MARSQILAMLLLGCLALAALAGGYQGRAVALVALGAEKEVANQPAAEALADGDAEAGDKKGNDAASILLSLWSDVRMELQRGIQGLNALIAFVCGIVLLADSKRSFRALVIFLVWILALVISQSEISDFLGVGPRKPICYFGAVQIAILVALAAWKGMDGMLILVTALLGCLLAFMLQVPLVHWGVDQLSDSRWVIVTYYSFFAWGSLYLYKNNMHRHVLAFICSVVGGALATSAVAWSVTTLYLKGVQDGNLHPVGGSWLDFVMLLFSTDQDIGLFVGSSEQHNVDLIVDRGLWLLLTLVGTIYQCKQLKKELAPGKVAAREGLSERLIEVESA